MMTDFQAPTLDTTTDDIGRTLILLQTVTRGLVIATDRVDHELEGGGDGGGSHP